MFTSNIVSQKHQHAEHDQVAEPVAVGAQPPAVGAELAVGAAGRSVRRRHAAAAAGDRPAVGSTAAVVARPVAAAAFEPAEPAALAEVETDADEAAAGPSPGEDLGRSDFEDFHTFVDQAGPGDHVHRQTFMKSAILKVQQTIDRMHTMKCVQCHRGEIVEKAVRPSDETHLCAFCKRDRNCDIPFYSHANHTVGSAFTFRSCYSTVGNPHIAITLNVD